MARGKFIVICGVDGCGKTYLVNQLAKEFENNDKVIFTREPGSRLPKSKSACEQIRRVIKDNNLHNTTDRLLFLATRAEHSKEVAELIEEGYVVISDRYMPTSIVYQHAKMSSLKDPKYSDVSMNEIIDDHVRFIGEDFLKDITYVLINEPDEIVINRARQSAKCDRLDYKALSNIALVKQSYFKAFNILRDRGLRDNLYITSNGCDDTGNANFNLVSTIIKQYIDIK